jgi:hypothetical protein
MSLLTQKQIEEIQKIHDDIGECTFPHEECFIKKLIEWNEKQTFQSEQEINNVGYLYKQKDCYGAIETVFSFDKPYITWHNVTDVTPVYTAPPKCEPSMTGREMYQRGYAKAERDLKRKPLSDATIAELWGEEHSGKTGMVKNFARAIEKSHNIGIVE